MLFLFSSKKHISFCGGVGLAKHFLGLMRIVCFIVRNVDSAKSDRCIMDESVPGRIIRAFKICIIIITAVCVLI